MSLKALPGRACQKCATQLGPTSANCPSCGKLDFLRLRLDLARGFAPVALAGLLFFGGLAAATVLFNAQSTADSLSSALDNPSPP
jgi:hypothetical protein